MKKVVPKDAILIPQHARSVFKGVIFDVFQWDQKMYDGSTSTFEMLRRPDSVDILLVRDDEVLIIRDEQPNRQAILSLPSGRVDPEEEWLGAAKRELREETGFSCETWKLVSVLQPLQKLEWFDAIFVASDILTVSDQELDGGEKIELIWREYTGLRQAILDGTEPSLDYLCSIVRKAKTTAELLALPEFSGKEIDV